MTLALVTMSMIIMIPYHHIDAQPNSEPSTAEPPITQSELIQSFGSQNKLLATINVTEFPKNIAVNPETNMVYVTHDPPYLEGVGDLGNMSVIDGKTNKIIKGVLLGNDPNAIAVNPETNMVYVAV